MAPLVLRRSLGTKDRKHKGHDSTARVPTPPLVWSVKLEDKENQYHLRGLDNIRTWLAASLGKTSGVCKPPGGAQSASMQHRGRGGEREAKRRLRPPPTPHPHRDPWVVIIYTNPRGQEDPEPGGGAERRALGNVDFKTGGHSSIWCWQRMPAWWLGNKWGPLLRQGSLQKKRVWEADGPLAPLGSIAFLYTSVLLGHKRTP